MSDGPPTVDADPPPAAGYRTYEVYQRERVAEADPGFVPRELLRDEMLTDPHRLLTLMREHTPCYRDWVGNQFWITRYDDVTSVLRDDANYETRTKRWFADLGDLGRDLGDEVPVLQAEADRIDAALDTVVDRVLAGLGDTPELATGLAGRLPLELWAAILDLPADDVAAFAGRYWRLQRGATWHPDARRRASAAAAELVEQFTPIVAARRAAPGDDLVSAMVGLEVDDEPVGAGDVVATVFERDHETLHGGLANLWGLLLTHPDQLEAVRADPRLVKFAWFETLRHSPPVHTARRFARHEVERFGRLLPEGALLRCSAAAANRDPRVFADPERFDVERPDLCQREPRGQYRADGLPAGVAPGLGTPSLHPAVPKERPRSRYAIVRDVAVTVSRRLLEERPAIRLAPGAEVSMRSLRLDEMYACWSLPVTW